MLAPSDSLHALELRFVHRDLGQPVLYLGAEPSGFELTLTNRSADNITLPSGLGCLALLFRPGLMDLTVPVTLTDGDAGWSLRSEVPGRGEANTGALRLTLTRTGDAITLPPDGAIAVRVEGMRADEARGARESTVRLEYLVHHADGPLVSGRRHHRVAVLHLTPSALDKQLADLRAQAEELASKPGYDDTALAQALATCMTELGRLSGALVCPLTVDVVGSTAVGNGVSRVSTITLRLQNGGRDITLSSATTLVVRLDRYGPATPWGLIQDGGLSAVRHTPPTGWGGTAEPLADAWRLTLRPSPGTVLLRANEALMVDLTQVTAASAPGPARIAVSYEGLDGHAGTTFARVERTRLLSEADGARVLGPLQLDNGLLAATVGSDRGVILQGGSASHQIRIGCSDSAANADRTELREAGEVVISVGVSAALPAGRQSRFSADGRVSVPGPLRVGDAAEGYTVPSGTIVMWKGSVSDVPAGWKLCDGANGTPDLRGRFVVGASALGGEYSVGPHNDGMASMTLQANHIPRHTHTITASQAEHTHGFSVNLGMRWGSMSGHGSECARQGAVVSATGTTDGQAPAVTAWASEWGGKAGGLADAFDRRPPYYALCFIMKT